MAKEITLNVNDTPLVFAVELTDYNGYVNELMPNNKVAPARNFLMRSVTPDSKEALRDIVDLPGFAVQIASALIEVYMPDVTITVGK